MFIWIKFDKTLAKDQLNRIAKPAAYVAIALVVVASTAVMVERFSRLPDGSHDLSI